MVNYKPFINLFFIFIFFLSTQIFANIYSSQLKVSNPDGTVFDGNFADGTPAVLSFFLNDSATSVIIEIIDAVDKSVVHTIDLGATGRSYHEAIWNGEGAVSNKTYIYQITAKQNNYSNTNWTIFYDSGGIGIFSRGLDIVTDMTHPNFGLMYAPNNGGPLGKGITIYNPDASQFDTFLVAKDVSEGGSIDWGSGDPFAAGVFDDLGRFYVSSIPFGEIRRLNLDYTITPVLTSYTNPLGIFITGTGENRTIYFCSDTKVFKAPIGNDDTFSGFTEEIATFDNIIPRAIAIDDDNNLYVACRTNATDLNSNGAGLYKFSLNGNLPVVITDAIWSFDETVTHKISDMQIDYGNDRNTSNDDVLYYATRADANNNDDGVWKIANLSSAFTQPEKVITEIELYGGDDNINARSGIALDAAGNIILFENANEHIFFIAPPGSGTENSFVTTAPELITVSVATDVEDNNIPTEFSLKQNYPNPFNPSTTIQYSVPSSVKREMSNVKLIVYDVLGTEVATLVEENKSPGIYEVEWTATGFASGVYFYRLKAGDFNSVKKLVLMK